MQKFKFGSIKPNKVILPEGEKQYPYGINELIIPSDFTISVTISNGSYTGDTVISQGEVVVITLAADDNYSLPESITVTNATYEYDDSTGEVTMTDPTGNPTIVAACVANGYPIAVSITNGSYLGDDLILIGGTASVTLTAESGALLPSSVTVVGAEASYNASTGVVSLSNATGNVSITAVCIIVDSTLANNSWDVIRKVCEAGAAGDYWALGDTKTDVGTDNVTRTMRICDMQGLYGKHIVFEQVEQESTTYVWNADTNVDDDDAYNDYNIANIRTSMNTTVKALYSNELQSALTATTVKVAKNGNSSTILDVTDYLFLPAEKEIFGSVSYSRSEEGAVLTQFSLYQANNTASFRIKQRGGQNKAWWLRSPFSGSTSSVCRVNDDGSAVSVSAGRELGVAPCFAF